MTHYKEHFPDNETLGEIFSFLTRKELSENVRLVNTHLFQIIKEHARQIHTLGRLHLHRNQLTLFPERDIRNDGLCTTHKIDFFNIPPNFVKFVIISIFLEQEWREKEIDFLRSTPRECFLNSFVTIMLRNGTTKEFAAELMEKTFVLCKKLDYTVKYTNQEKKKSNQRSCWPFCIRSSSPSVPIQPNRLNLSSVIVWLHDPFSSQQNEDHQTLLFGEHLGRILYIKDIKDPKFHQELLDEIKKVFLSGKSACTFVVGLYDRGWENFVDFRLINEYTNEELLFENVECAPEEYDSWPYKFPDFRRYLYRRSLKPIKQNNDDFPHSI